MLSIDGLAGLAGPKHFSRAGSKIPDVAGAVGRGVDEGVGTAVGRGRR